MPAPAKRGTRGGYSTRPAAPEEAHGSARLCHSKTLSGGCLLAIYAPWARQRAIDGLPYFEAVGRVVTTIFLY